MIHKKLLVIPELEIDEQTKINHDGCPSGVDTRQRLYVKRVGPSAYIGHCFNCGESGYSFGDLLSRAEDIKEHRDHYTSKYNFVSALDTLPSLATKELPLHVKEYLLKYQIHPEEAVNLLNYRYVKRFDMLLMPFYQSRNTLGYSFQTRTFSSDKPRYLTRNKTETVPMFSKISSTPILEPKLLVLVEDQISAYRVMREGGDVVDSIALLGTSLSPATMSFIKSHMEAYTDSKLVIWLDNDPAGLKAANEAFKRLTPLYPGRVIPSYMPQPKDMSVDVLERALRLWVP